MFVRYVRDRGKEERGTEPELNELQRLKPTHCHELSSSSALTLAFAHCSPIQWRIQGWA